MGRSRHHFASLQEMRDRRPCASNEAAHRNLLLTSQHIMNQDKKQPNRSPRKSTEITGQIVLPETWKQLAQTVFEEGLRDIGDGDAIGRASRSHEEEARRLTDPAPKYDDHRAIHTRLSDGSLFGIVLMSGQKNYWAVTEILRPKERITSEPYVDFPDTEHITSGELEVVVEIEWTDPETFVATQVKRCRQTGV